jgi:hypothetical protein
MAAIELGRRKLLDALALVRLCVVAVPTTGSSSPPVRALKLRR